MKTYTNNAVGLSGDGDLFEIWDDQESGSSDSGSSDSGSSDSGSY